MTQVTEHKQKFERAVATMDVPEMRKEGNAFNARWFLRNGPVRNSEHPNILTAILHAKRLAQIKPA